MTGRTDAPAGDIARVGLDRVGLDLEAWVGIEPAYADLQSAA